MSAAKAPPPAASAEKIKVVICEDQPQVLKNQLKILQESKDEAARYNDNVKTIAASYSDVGTKTALVLNQLKNQLPVAEALQRREKSFTISW